MHKFVWNTQGDMEHWINDELRAVVQPAHCAEYKTFWPDAPLALV